MTSSGALPSTELSLSAEPRAYSAVDIGAESGRVVLGHLDGGQVKLEEVHRFANRPVRLHDGRRWDLLHLFAEAVSGLAAASARVKRMDGIGIDAWAVDYALLDENHRILGLPLHYRDPSASTSVERAFARVPAREMYEITGIQTMPINTVFRLLADQESSALAGARRIALVPDLLSLWLCGELANERTVASSTGLLDAVSGDWARGLIARLGLPGHIFGELVDPGTILGPVAPRHELGSTPVIATASHDTAAAFAAAPIVDEDSAAILVSGTWSLLGLELPGPLLTDVARGANLTNERGVEGTTRLLKNVMGLWLVQESRRVWAERGEELSYQELMRIAADSCADDGRIALFDPDHPTLLSPGDMPARIAALCAASDQVTAANPGEMIRSVLLSLSCKYRFVLEDLERASGRAITCMHVIGGGAQNQVLCALTADMLGCMVKAGPIEATAMGNVLVQARATGELSSLQDMRAVAVASVAPVIYEPRGGRDRADQLYQRFLNVTGLSRPTFPLATGG